MKRFSFILAVFLVATSLVAQGKNPGTSVLQAVARSLDGSIPGWSWAPDSREYISYSLGESLKAKEIYLKASLSTPLIFAGNRIEGQEAFCRLKMVSQGLSRIRFFVDQQFVKEISLDGSSGVDAAGETDVPVPAGAHELRMQVTNEGLAPPRGDMWPERRRSLNEELSSFHLLSAEWVFPQIADNVARLRNWLDSFKTATTLLNPELIRHTFTGKPFPIEDKRKVSPAKLAELNRSLTLALSILDQKALAIGDWPALSRSLEKSYSRAGKIREYVASFQVFLIGNAHIDIAWLWRMAETEQVARNTFATVMNNMAEYPEMRFAQSQAIAYEWMEKKYPDVFRRIQEKVKAGQWEIVGGMWVEPDCNLISGESMVRQILFGKNYFKEKFAIDVKIGWNPDSFGYNWNMPQILKKSGFDYFLTQKISWNDTTIFPYYLFWWQGVDGSRLLTYFPPESYTANLHLQPTVDKIAKYEAVTGYKKSLILYGLGDHGGGPNREMLDRVRTMQKLPMAPTFIHARTKDFLKNIQADLGKTIPTWNSELYLQYHQGTYTTQAATKRNNRRSEALASSTEKFATAALALGNAYPAQDLHDAWKTILTNQFHDILPGSSITPVYRDAAETYRQAQGKLERIRSASLQQIASRINTDRAPGKPILVFNPLSWKRSDYVSIRIPAENLRDFCLTDAVGRDIPVEVNMRENSLEIGFIAEDVPGIGYKVYTLVPGKKEENSPEMTVSGWRAENRFYRLEINPQTGNIRSLFAKGMGREMVRPGEEANVLEIHEDIPEDWDAWNIGYTGRKWELNTPDSVEWLTQTPVRAVLRVKKSFLGFAKSTREYPTENFPSSFFIQDIVLYRNLDRIDVRMEADWWETHMFLKVKFPVAVTSDFATYEIPFGAIQRTTRFVTAAEKAQFETAALKWVDLSDSAGGLSLLNEGKYGHDIHGYTMKLSLLRSPTWPDPMADRGKHSFTYSLYAHPGSWNEAETVRRGAELNQPLIALATERHAGEWPAEASFFTLDGAGVILDTVKKAETGDALIFRFYESLGRPASVTLQAFKGMKKVCETDLLENEMQEVPISGKSLRLDFRPFEIRTLKIVLE